MCIMDDLLRNVYILVCGTISWWRCAQSRVISDVSVSGTDNIDHSTHIVGWLATIRFTFYQLNMEGAGVLVSVSEALRIFLFYEHFAFKVMFSNNNATKVFGRLQRLLLTGRLAEMFFHLLRKY